MTSTHKGTSSEGVPARDEFSNRMDAYRTWLVDAEHKAYQSFDKAVMTLSGGALAISLTFVKDIFKSPKQETLFVLELAWLCLGASIVAILVSILTGASALRRAVEQVDKGTIEKQLAGGRYATATKAFNVVACAGFVLGVCFLAWFAISNMIKA